MACTWLNLVKDVDMNIFTGFSTEDELEYYFLNRQFQDNVTVVAGLVFENFNDHMDTLPSHVHYNIRQIATLNPETNIIRPPFWYLSRGSNDLLYYEFGFVWIQVKDIYFVIVFNLNCAQFLLKTYIVTD
ncbi:ATP-binding cassette sub-family A member 2-like [Ruditapes philippinarum]|uniref:ATP-binding cassette sub-family A member 2-like n=1 Tax=Ruditapes philippinarum TaxID=129788 RepID=UPI00295AD7DE|nr:ATP-binding cassette sub-family A member 2-like [Ruditapes philippinarum]